MFCPNCGANNQDGELNCSHCNANLSAANAKNSPMSKKEFFATIASDNAKKFRKLALIMGILCIVFAVASAFITANTSIFEIPIFNMIDDGFNDIEEQYEDAMDKFDDLTDKEIDEIEDEFDMDFNEIKELYKNPSLSNMKELAVGLDTDEDVEMIFSAFNAIIFGYALFIALFELLAVLLKKGGFAIATIIISILYFVLLAGMLMFVLFIILNIAQIVLYSMANKEYKAYKKTC